MEIEMMMTKIRWEHKRQVQHTQDQLFGDMRTKCEKTLEKQPRDPSTGTIDLTKLRPTQLSTVRLVVVPYLGSKEEEQKLQDLKSDLLTTTKKYVKDNCDTKGQPHPEPHPQGDPPES